jgi:hypothetical protein
MAAGGQVDDRQARVAKADLCPPAADTLGPPIVWTSVMELT